MARVYFDQEIGSGDYVTVDLDPADYYWEDGIVDGTLITTELVDDRFRPANPPQGGWQFIRRFVRNSPPQPRWLVMDSGATAAPSGAYDLGDPTVDADMQRVMSNPEANAVGNFLDVDASGQTIEWAILNAATDWASDPAGWWAQVRARMAGAS